MSALSISIATADAVQHIIDRLKVDPRLAYLIGPGSQSFDLLTAAYAEWRDVPLGAYRDQLRATLNFQPLPGIGKKAGVIDQELLARIAVYDDQAHNMDDQDDLDMLINHFVGRGLDVAEAERDTLTKELF